MRSWNTHPFHEITLAGGKGSTVWDDRGKTYLDLLSGTWCATLGHGHPRWAAAVQRQAAGLVHAGSGFPSEGLAAGLAKLGEILPPELDRAVFLSSGSEAVELALKMARAATGGNEIVITEGAFYGSTPYALSLSEVGRSMPYLPAPGTVHRLPKPDCRRCPMGCGQGCNQTFPCLEPLEKLRGRPIAAVLYEPAISGAGILLLPPGYAARLKELAAACGAPLVCNEVTTGMGRTGRWFGFEHGGLVPDLLVLGKVLGAGLPVAAVATTAALEAACGGRLLHGQSHQNDPFSGALAAEVIAILQDEGLVARAARVGEHLRGGLAGVMARVPWIREVRCLGAMVGIEVQEDAHARGPEWARRLLQRGFIVNYQPLSRSFRLFPPFVITETELDAFLEAFEGVLREPL